MTETNTFHVEYTDTFAGNANYSWVKRQTILVPRGSHRRKLMRAAKAAVGLTGVRGKVRDYGDTIEFRPSRTCTVMFVTIEH
jgi:hypothetical protein